MKTAHLTWEEVVEQEGHNKVQVYSITWSMVEGDAKDLTRLMQGCEVTRLAKGVYQVTRWPEETPSCTRTEREEANHDTRAESHQFTDLVDG